MLWTGTIYFVRPTVAIMCFLFLLLLFSGILRPGVLGNYHEEKVIIDTDAGADDAMAILLLISERAIKEKGINVIAITCVDGNVGVDTVAENVLKTLKTAERLDIPVYKGASHPLIRNSSPDYYFGKDAFGDFDYPNAPDPDDYLKEEHGVLALIRLVRQYPGEITLVAIAPLTNIGLAIRLYPNFLKLLKRVVILGGSVNGVGNVKPGLEFNFQFDPEAADIVLSSAVSPVCLIPWETLKLHSYISMGWRKIVLGKINTPAIQLLNKAENIYSRTGDQWIGADPAAAILVLRRDVSTLAGTKTSCGGNPQYAQVVVDSELISGGVVVDYANTTMNRANVEIIEGLHSPIYKTALIHYSGL